MTIGWYIHHHGSGHLRRFEAVRPHLGSVVALSSLPRPPHLSEAEWVTLPLDAPACAPGQDPTAGGLLHWAPLAHSGLRARMARIAGWLEQTPASLLVCDVSVEVALLARLAGVPVAWIAQRGVRTDPPHQLAYGLSHVLAPWSPRLAEPSSGLPDHTRFVGAVSRYDDRAPVPPPGRRRVLVALGDGGHAVSAEELAGAATASASAGWRWSVAGLDAPVAPPVCDHGRVKDLWPLLTAADAVVTSAGSNLIAEVAAARRPLVCLPQARPFDEQLEQGTALARADLAETLDRWPAPAAWTGILERALSRETGRWAEVHDGRGATRLAAVITELAEPGCGSA